MAEPAPTPRQDEKPLDYILRVCEYLAEPDRRRLGEQTLAHVERAVARIREVI